MNKRDRLGRFTSKGMMGKNNPKWVGDRVGYSAVHGWMTRYYGKADMCEDCKSDKIVQWANVSRKYLRNRKDWKMLCASCHDAFDGIAKLTKEQVSEIKKRYNFRGKDNQVSMAKEFGVSQMTISNIINNKVKYYA